MSDTQAAIDQARRSMNEAAQECEAYLLEGQKAARRAADCVEETEEQLDYLSEKTAKEAEIVSALIVRLNQDQVTAKSIGDRVRVLFEQLLALFEEIKAEEKICASMEKRIEKARSQSSSVLKTLASDCNQILDLSDRVQKNSAAAYESLHQITIDLDGFDRARAQVTQIVAHFFQEGLRTVHQAVADTAFESFLADSDQRLARVQIHAQQATTTLPERVTMDVELSGFAEEAVVELSKKLLAVAEQRTADSRPKTKMARTGKTIEKSGESA